MTLFLLFALPFRGDGASPSEIQEAQGRFGRILYYYERIRGGLPGSRGFHCYEMSEYLKKQTGGLISTDNDFRLVCDGPSLRIVPAFQERSWLVLHLKGLPEALDVLKKRDNPPPFQEWWRRGILISVTGKLSHFRLDRGERVSVHLYLSDISIESLIP